MPSPGVMPSPIVEQDIARILEAVGDDFRRFSGQPLLLTGGTGFVGQYLLRTLLALNDRVLSEPCRIYVVTRNPGLAQARLPHLAHRPDVVLLEGDVRSVRLPSVPWRFVIHAAAPSDARVFSTDPLGTVDTIVEGTKAILRAAGEAKADACLFVSSGAVYGVQPPDRARLDEAYQGGPDLTTVKSCYAEAKRYAEMLCRIHAEQQGVPVSIGRLFALVGPYQELNSTSAVVDFVRQALDGDTIRIKDDGQTVRSYCYIADAVIGLWKVLLSRPAGGVFNIGCDMEAVTFVELAQRIGRCLGKTLQVVVEGAPASGVLGRCYVPDVTRLSREIGFKPATSLDETLRRTITWMREQRKGGQLCATPGAATPSAGLHAE